MQVIHGPYLRHFSEFVTIGSVLLFVLSVMAPHVNAGFWERASSLVCAIAAARFTSRIISPLTAILFKWLLIGRYRAGQYPM
jgi:hypothetical protein